MNQQKNAFRTSLNWPGETTERDQDSGTLWQHAGSNLCLDLHGDPAQAQLVVFSDGNHHMALAECLRLFRQATPGLESIFYATTPPSVLLQWLHKGALTVGNLCLRVLPHVFLSPPHVLDGVVQCGRMTSHQPFMRNQGNVLLVRKDNPKGIHGIADLARPEVRLFLSNPKTETVSYQGYADSLRGIAQAQGVDLDFLDNVSASSDKLMYGESIHHREAPQCLVDGHADVAMVYYHLALRYVRVFADHFELIPLGGDVTQPQPVVENLVSTIHRGIIDDGGAYGQALLDFLASEEVAKIYRHHGLLPAL